MGLINGHFRVSIHEDGLLMAEAEADNLMTNTGYAVMAQSCLFSGVVDQNANLGLLIPPAYMFPVYGAVGTGSTTPTAGDTQLASESARATVYTGSTSGTTWTWNFFFGTANTIAISEAGVFLQASATVNSGQLLDHALISPTVTKNSGQTATLSVTFTLS